jgi:hypothetical protein
MNTSVALLASARRHARLDTIGILAALVVASAAPTALGLAAGALVLFGVGVAAWIAPCPWCGRRRGPITSFKFCNSCHRRILQRDGRRGPR